MIPKTHFVAVGAGSMHGGILNRNHLIMEWYLDAGINGGKDIEWTGSLGMLFEQV